MSQAPALARAVAVLGDQARLAWCAELAGVDRRLARTLATGLVDLSVLVSGEPLRFVHPVVRTAIYADLSAEERADLHARAARLLVDHRADQAAAAVHLLATTPSGDPAVVAMLREAARSALAGGAPDTAATLLRRALDEPPDSSTGRACCSSSAMPSTRSATPRAHGHLRAAGETTTDPLLRAQAFMALAWTTHPDARRQREQLPFYELAAAQVEAHDHELALQLEAARLGALLLNPDLPVKYEPEADRFTDVPALTAAECLLRSFVARRALEGGPVARAGDLAEEAASHPALVSQGGHPLWRTNITICLVEAERYDVAERFLSGAIRHAERNGSPQWLARALWLRGLARHRRGDLRAAEVDARGSVDIQGLALDYTKSPGLVVVIDSLADQGRADEGEALLAEKGMDGELDPTLFSVLPLLARGRLRAAAGHYVRARADLEDALHRIGLSRGLFPWAADGRIALVPVLTALGDDDEARGVAEEALTAATAAASCRRIGGALRVLGLVEGGERGLDLLRRSVETLQSSPALLWRAQAQVDLGTALRRDGQDRAAREFLREGMELAHRCGATPLADLAVVRAAGGRWTTAAPGRRGCRRADHQRAAGGRTGRRWGEQQGDRSVAVRHPAHRRAAPLQRLQQAADPVTPRAFRSAGFLTEGQKTSVNASVARRSARPPRRVDTEIQVLVVGLRTGRTAMKYASCIGRVGALAVALGVGTAISGAPGVAWGAPEDAGSGAASSDSSSQSSGSPAPGESATSSAAGSADDPSADPSPGSAGDPAESVLLVCGRCDALTGGMKIDSSGGAHTSTKEREAVEADDGVAQSRAGRRTSRRRRSASRSRIQNRRANRGRAAAVRSRWCCRRPADIKRAADPVSAPDPKPAADPVRPADPVVVQRPMRGGRRFQRRQRCLRRS